MWCVIQLVCMRMVLGGYAVEVMDLSADQGVWLEIWAMAANSSRIVPPPQLSIENC